MGIKVEIIRVNGFRGLNNIEVYLDKTTVLTGMNNAGKTSLLKALQIAFGNKQFINDADFHISENKKSEEIKVDVKIAPVNDENEVTSQFDEDWIEVLTDERIIIDSSGNQYVPIRTVISFDRLKSSFKTKQFILREWQEFQSAEKTFWFQSDNGVERSFHLDEIPFFYVDAQRDIVEDIKVRNSYLGKLISSISYSAEDLKKIERQIKELNEEAVQSSDILTNIQNTLKDLDSAMDSADGGVDISPFPKKVRDLNKGVSIQYSDFSMDYHGMGTRSWSSLLTLKSFVSLFEKNSNDNYTPFFPIIAIEEPEAHLHPNAQKKLYDQISKIPGQKIIATHSSYIAASAEIEQIRSFYKDAGSIKNGWFDISMFSSEDIRKIKRQVINTRGELFFSKFIILFEGETEEQALPIFAEKHFNKKLSELGIDFIGVGGYGNYLTFIRFAESLNIPWYIFSDAEKKVKESVNSQLSSKEVDSSNSGNVIFVRDNCDFEKYLIEDGYEKEIRKAILKKELEKCVNEKHKSAKEKEINEYNKDRLYSVISEEKTFYAPEIAQQIINSKKSLPGQISKLFEKVKEKLQW